MFEAYTERMPSHGYKLDCRYQKTLRMYREALPPIATEYRFVQLTCGAD
jgi:hypothetical protein